MHRRAFTRGHVVYYRCRSCGVVRAQAPDGGASQGRYDTIYQHKSSPNPITQQRYRDLLRSLARFRQTGRLLEIGCGRGYFLEVARDEGWSVAGTETSREAQADATRRGLPVLLGDVDDQALESGAFDVVVLLEVLEHLDQPFRYLRTAHRLLRPGGALLLSTPNVDSLTRRLVGSRWRVFSPDHVHLFSARAARSALEAAGFAVLDLGAVNLDPYELRAKLRRRTVDGFARRPAAGGRQANAEALRAAVYARPWLRAGKDAANRVLRLLGLGDTLYVLARRRA